MGAYPFLTSTEFTKAWYIHMVERFDDEMRQKIKALEAEIVYQEKQLARADTAAKRSRVRKRLREAQRRLHEYVEFYGGE